MVTAAPDGEEAKEVGGLAVTIDGRTAVEEDDTKALDSLSDAKLSAILDAVVAAANVFSSVAVLFDNAARVPW